MIHNEERAPISNLRVAVSGYYGCGNTGDEAVLAGILESFKRRNAAVEFTVFSARPEDTHRLHGVRAVDRIRGVGPALKEADLLLSGGGSLLQDTTSLRSLLYYLWVTRTAQRMNRPVMLYAQGIGPLRRPVARMLVRRFANRVNYITVRDEPSADLLTRVGVNRPTVEVTADPAFALTPESNGRADEILRTEGIDPSRPIAGFAIRPWKLQGVPVESWAKMTRIVAKSGMQIVFLPMHLPDDRDLSERVASQFDEARVIRAPLSPAEAVAVVGRFGGVVAMRLHALIFGAMGGVPLLALGYDPKVWSLMNRLGQKDHVLSLDSFDPGQAAQSFLNSMEDRSSVSAILRQASREMAGLNEINVDRALSLALS